MTRTIATTYDPSSVETSWYQYWEDNGNFQASDSSDKPAYCISMPPPNVTGSLHNGHALTATLQDILIRWRRMCGYNALWTPGTDHAGIATQMMVERDLAKEGLSRFDLGREAFLARVWEWKKTYHARITAQHKRLGISCDWERERFTMDEGLSEAVREVFVRLYEEGLIYQAERLVNWCPKMHTVLSDLEVDNEEVEGHLWHMAYPVKGSDQKLIVATTRPETMLGDTAVAVHPDDPRYRDLIGKTVLLPLTDREIPVVADDILVDMEFGTGCVKVTPAHDFNDFETGKRHDLAMINIMDEDACLNENVPTAYQGLDRYEARERIVADLDAAGLLVKIEDHKLSIGKSQRSGETVEPMLSKQWFVRADVLAKEAIRVVEEGEIKIIPPHWKKTYFHWMYNIRDWCISRQLWWGHRIPAWYCQACGEVTVQRETPTQCVHCQSSDLQQDEDVLDTWFSSGLWPFSTLGWPKPTKALSTFYPNSVMETGHDILFFWVARMIMMGCKFMGGVPFQTVYLHAMVRDEHGKKMSKTTGNVIDPLEIIETHGADALRFTLASLTVAGRSIKLSMDRVTGYRNFANKIWNASRFVFMNLEDYDPTSPPPESLNAADQWILTKLNEATQNVSDELEAFDFGSAAATVYQFFWHEFCDWYIELAKVSLSGSNRGATQHTLRAVLDGALRLLHPFMPHLTSELWHHLPGTNSSESTLMVESYAIEGIQSYPKEAAALDQVLAIVSAVRNIRGENKIPPSKPISLLISAGAKAATVEEGRAYITRLARAESLEVQSLLEAPEGSAAVRAGEVDVIVPLQGLVDFEKERNRLLKVLKKLEDDISKSERKLGNPKYVERANPDAVQRERDKLSRLQAEQHTATQSLERLPQS